MLLLLITICCKLLYIFSNRPSIYLLRGLCSVFRSKAGQFEAVAAPPGIAERVTRDYISSSVCMGNDSDQEDDVDDHMTSAEDAPNYTNNHHHVVLVEGGGVNEEIRSGPSRNVGYYDATSLYPSSGVLYRHFFCQGDLQGRGPCPRKARPRHGPRCCCCRPVPAWRGPQPRPRGTWVSIETVYHVYFFIYRIDQCAGGTVSRIVHFGGSGSCCSSL